MNKLLIPCLFIACLLMTSCLNDDEPKDKVEEIRIEVSYETGITYHWGDDKKEYPIECMLVKLPNDPDRWQTMMFGEIEGFTYERGHEYYLSVRRTTLANPPADASCYTYSLVKILSDKLVVEPGESIDNEIKKEEDIEYYDLCPLEKYEIRYEFEIDDNGDIFYRSSQTTGMPYDACRIWLEVVLDKADPDYLTFIGTSYMAIYSYVLSPFSDEIRRVYNESHGPMFKNVVPQNEFDYICREMKSGDELHYALILANIHKKGLQKLEFIIKKK